MDALPRYRNIIGRWCPSAGATGFRLIDRSGRGNHGTLTNMTASAWIAVGRQRALDFSGGNEIIPISGSYTYVQASVPFSVSFFANVKSFSNATYQKVCLLKSDDASNNAYEIGFSNAVGQYDGVLVGTANSYARLRTQTSASVLQSGMAHYCVTYNGLGSSTATNFRAFRNGVELTLTSAGAFSATTNTSSISLNAGNNVLNSQLDDLTIWNVCLTDSEIQKIYQLGRGFGVYSQFDYDETRSTVNRLRRVLLTTGA